MREERGKGFIVLRFAFLCFESKVCAVAVLWFGAVSLARVHDTSASLLLVFLKGWGDGLGAWSLGVFFLWDLGWMEEWVMCEKDGKREREERRGERRGE